MGQSEQPAAGGDRSTAGVAAPHTPRWQTCGQHRFYRRDDVLFWEAHGPMMVQDLMVLFAERIALQRQHGRVFIVCDAHASAGIPAESRKYAAKFKSELPIQGAVAVFGAGLLVRAALSLLIGAGRLLGRRDLRTVFFASDEAEAWTILERERSALDTAQPTGSGVGEQRMNSD